ncbi:hypothetical protein SBOR_9820 [Sclerotinia borealis F-4128]|uniref:Uncharacterized protein n=1 Tax=Sclerotinia borealis (strain F-4128) TaxID=1432307 RepID=W9C1Q3_SCLBF|nr:hypothetical protein SBOR_9820 [Sclerotinia borealis F-4128]
MSDITYTTWACGHTTSSSKPREPRREKIKRSLKRVISAGKSTEQSGTEGFKSGMKRVLTLGMSDSRSRTT